ncbi:acetylxylan esterase [Microvirga tunisiensis]|uniref:Acetylxylan esterase n=1 Tax=Microvirga tunisiensis TaxID=2108360 RepID=A0A5N7MBW6_9HYPH|nr:acetylxylan esterase [Microvirga tunisiensis]MPR05539.1 acetylxylan esterase [Microvirga tunisiensis]MPR23739.1 acetylxylan esterase [Microvirga tunisiensis]
MNWSHQSAGAVADLGLLDVVDRNRIDVPGVCGNGGLNLSATAADNRIKAVASSMMYDMARLWVTGFQDGYTPEQRSKALKNTRLRR